MAQVINTNIASLNAQRNLNSSQGQLATSLTRLSSGLRINSARDDAAGLAIAERFTTQITGLNVASRNANDGISLSQTAEGAMGEIGNNLQRIRELAVQAANFTNSEGDREALNNEVQELISEIDRVAKQTDFNGTNLLDGSFAGALFQIGANAGQTISINNIVNASADTIGSGQFAVDDSDTITASANSEIGAASWGTGRVDTEGNALADSTGLTINTVSIDAFVQSDDADVNAQRLAAAINDKMDQHGVYATVDGAEVTIASIKEGEDRNIVNAAGDGVSTDFDVTALASAGAALAAENIDVSDFTGAQRAIELATVALNEVNTARSEMGAVQNRFESVIANLATTTENLTASRSRIEDADFAAETANLTRSQILQQAGTSMLAQANSLPQNVLSLLQ